MAIFEGAGVALVTPFKDNGEINYEKLEELLEGQIAEGTDAIISCGTTGESSTMTHEEHIEVVRYTCQVVKGRIPVVAGTGSNCTREAIHLSQEAQKAGADGLLLVTPYYNKATQKGLIAHYTSIAESVKIPILLYHIPGRTGVTMKPESIVTLCREVSNIVGVKEASGNFSSIATMMSMADGSIDLYSGNDDQIVPLLAMGGKGVISVLSNVAPRETHDICEKYFNGDVTGSAALQLKAIPLCEQLFSEVNPIPVKKAMQLMGMDCGPLRMPLTELTPAHEKALAQAMKDFGIKVVE